MIESRENNVINTPVRITLTACILFLFAGIFYLYEFFVRTSIGTIEPFFRLSVNVDAKDIEEEVNDKYEFEIQRKEKEEELEGEEIEKNL